MHIDAPVPMANVVSIVLIASLVELKQGARLRSLPARVAPLWPPAQLRTCSTRASQISTLAKICQASTLFATKDKTM